jgi:murein DD-endopeptidase MepM/ murein hydrolase activator NlpD
MKRYFILFTLLFPINFAFSQDSLSTKPKKNLSLYDVFYLNNSINTQQKTVESLEKKIILYQKRIFKTRTNINKIKSQLSISKDTYSHILTTLYLYKLNYSSSLIFLFSPDNFNKIFSRYNYLKLIVNYLSSLHKYLKILEKQQKYNKKILNSLTESLNVLTEAKIQNKQKLDSLYRLMYQQINILSVKSQLVKKQLEKSTNLNRQISNFLSSESFQKLKNTNLTDKKLSDPLSNPILISSFGIHNHPYLHNIRIENDGIDITSKTDNIVKAAATGVVAKILFIPNNGYSIILKHSNFFTVYSYLTKTLVNESDTVFRHQNIGMISKTYSKYSFPALNFQVWVDNHKVNPKQFLHL